MGKEEARVPDRILRWGLIGSWILLGILLLSLLLSLIQGPNAESALEAFGWPPEAADTIQKTKMGALLHAALMGGILVAVFVLATKWTLREKPALAWLPWVLVGIVAVDAAWLARHYIKTAPEGQYRSNYLTEYLTDNMTEGRLAVLGNASIYQQWKMYLFPYRGIPTFSSQVPFVGPEYQAMLGRLQNNPIRQWQLNAVQYVLLPTPLYQRLQQDRRFSAVGQPVMSFDVKQDREGAIFVQPASRGQHTLLQLSLDAPYGTLIRGWQRVPDEAGALQRITDAGHPLFERVLVEPEGAEGLPPMPEGGRIGRADLQERTPNRIVFTTRADEAAILRVAERYAPDWTARVDGDEVDVFKVDYLYQGLVVPPGQHEIVLSYEPTDASIWVQALGMGAVLLALGGYGFTRLRSRAKA